MSKVKIEGNASGTGTLTISAPNTNTDRSLTLPDGAGEILLANGDGSNLTGISSYSDSDALTLFNASGSAPVYACRAWVNFDGTNTVSITASGNVSSITDNGTGRYTVNFSTAMPDANYAVCSTSKFRASGYNEIVTTNGTNTTTDFDIRVVDGDSLSFVDVPAVYVAIFR